MSLLCADFHSRHSQQRSAKGLFVLLLSAIISACTQAEEARLSGCPTFQPQGSLCMTCKSFCWSDSPLCPSFPVNILSVSETLDLLRERWHASMTPPR